MSKSAYGFFMAMIGAVIAVCGWTVIGDHYAIGLLLSILGGGMFGFGIGSFFIGLGEE